MWEDGTALIYSRVEARRNVNIAANPRVSLHLNHDGTGSDVVSFEGLATIDAAAPPSHESAPYMRKYGDLIASMSREEFSRRFGVAIRVRPTRVNVFNA